MQTLGRVEAAWKMRIIKRRKARDQREEVLHRFRELLMAIKNCRKKKGQVMNKKEGMVQRVLSHSFL